MRVFLFISLFLSALCNAQNYQTVEDIDDACSQLGFMSDEDAQIAVDNILDKVGLFSNFTIAECPTINNAVAKMIEVEDGKKARYILYDNSFFNRIADKASNDWAAISILAHEIGHHLNGHSLNDQGSNHKWELEADEFSGFVLAKMGATLDDAQSAMQTLKYDKATRTHPAKVDRLNAIKKGWGRGSGNSFVDTEVTVNDISNIDDPKEDKSLALKAQGQEVLLNYIQAIGGQENIKKIKTLFTEVDQTTSFDLGNLELDDGLEIPKGIPSPVKTTYFTPNNFYFEMGSPNVFYFLKRNGNTYSKSTTPEGGTSKWVPGSFDDTGETHPSFVKEYGYLVNNIDIVSVDKEIIGGEEFDVVRLQDYHVKRDWPNANYESTSQRIYYYNSRTALLRFSKIKTRAKTLFKDKTVGNPDTDITKEIFTTYSDYRSVSGVLFAFKEEIKTTMGNDPMSTILSNEYKTIKINPEILQKDFDFKLN